MCWSKVKGLFVKEPNVIAIQDSFVMISRKDFLAILEEQGVKSLIKSQPLDHSVKLPIKSDLDKMAPSLVYPGDWYVEDLWDCEDYGLQAQLDAGRLFDRTVRLGIGDVDIPDYGMVGRHGWAIALDTNYRLWMLEPNAGLPWAGKWFKQGENGYALDRVFI